MTAIRPLKISNGCHDHGYSVVGLVSVGTTALLNDLDLWHGGRRSVGGLTLVDAETRASLYGQLKAQE
ncbi:hypothetical protein AGR1C_Lc10033 [Agrobacterium fabacearum TT111]|nr:hypothetical protein AGR1C_Lc10033 [Agrobacterium fabacearum TT111]